MLYIVSEMLIYWRVKMALFHMFKEALAVCAFMTVALPLIALVGYKIIF